VPPVSPDELHRDQPDAHRTHVCDGDLVARCSLWWTAGPSLPGERLGRIGHYYAADPAAGTALLHAACDELARRGCTLALGPMDGTTWRPYRLITDRGPEPPFFLELDHPEDWPAHYLGAGFTPQAHYLSALAPARPAADERLERQREHFARLGVTLRPVRLADWTHELRAVHAVTHAAFARNYLFSPLDEAAFIAQYRAVRSFVEAALFFLAEHAGRLVGFLFAVPDLLQARRGGPVDRLILKTLAVLPERPYLGLGSLLLGEAHVAAGRRGHRGVIHALMHESTLSLAASRYFEAQVIRRYDLFGRRLACRAPCTRSDADGTGREVT
jgi:GNAT superfamily N-acetyltransferase